jgi:hypothetical protein
MKNTHSDIIPDKALLSCWNILDKIEVGQKILISQYAPNKPYLFIECAKKYADCYGTILFSDDYQEIKKVNTFKQIKNLFAELKNNNVILSLK